MTDTKKLEPGSELHFALLGAPMGWNFLTGKDFADMQAFGRAVWQAAIKHERGDPIPAPTKEWLDEIENFGAREERLLDEIEAALKPFGGDILDNGPKGSMRYLSDHLKDLVIRWADGAMQHEREKCAEALRQESVFRWLDNEAHREGYMRLWRAFERVDRGAAMYFLPRAANQESPHG